MGKKPKSKNIFDHLKAITQKQDKDYFQNLTEGEKKGWSNYMINRWLSMDYDYIHVVNMIQEFQLSKEQLYRFYIDILPSNYRYFNYIKKSKSGKYNKELVELFSNHFYVSNDEAIEYLDILSSQEQFKEISSICSLYGIEEKKQKKWIKELKANEA